MICAFQNQPRTECSDKEAVLDEHRVQCWVLLILKADFSTRPLIHKRDRRSSKRSSVQLCSQILYDFQYLLASCRFTTLEAEAEL